MLSLELVYDRHMMLAEAIEQDWELAAGLAADLHDAHARLVELMTRVLAEGSWQAGGIRSPEHWLMLRAGLSRGQAAAIVLLARRQDDLPATAAALREGRISLDQAAVVARHTPAAFDATVAEFAQHATVTQLQRTVSKYDFTLEPDSHDEHGDLLPAEGASTEQPALVAPPSLTMGHDEDGRFRLRYDAPSEIGALVEAALAEAKDHLFNALSGGDEPDDVDRDRDGDEAGRPRVTWADALALMATRSVEAATTPERRSRFRVNVFLDTEGGWLTGTPRLPRHLIDGLTCDGTLTPVWTTGGHPVNVGDTQRTAPNRTRVLVRDRDRGCRFPGCSATRHVEVHHQTHWRDGGLTDLANLLLLCPFHHDAHHRGEFTITGTPTRADGLEFTTRTGLLIGPLRHRPSRHTDADTESDTEPDTEPDTESDTESVSGAEPDEGPLLDPAGLPMRARIARPAPPPGPPRTRPRPRLGRQYPAPTGGTLHLHLVDFTPPRPRAPTASADP
jgi:hypothetical protein